MTVRGAGTAGSRVELVATSPSHYEALYRLAQQPAVAGAWRTRGITVSFEDFVRLIWADTFVSFTICAAPSLEPIGLISLSNVDLRSRFGYVSMFLGSEAPGSVAFEAAMLFLDHVRTNFDLRCLYAEVGAAAAPSFGLGFGRLFTTEAVLPQREYHDGGYRDVVLARCDIGAIGPRLDRFRAQADARGDRGR